MADHYYADSGTGESTDRPAAGRMSLTWRDAIQVTAERAWVIVTVFAAAMTVAFMHTNRQVPMYQATARVQMDVPQPKAIKSDEVVDVNTRDYTFIFTQVKILQSFSLAERVAESLQLDKDREFKRGTGPGFDPAQAVKRAIRVESVANTRMVDITATHRNPEVAARLANGVAETYIRENLDLRMRTSLEAIQWLHRQAQEYKASLDKSELALQDYKEKQMSAARVDQQNIVLTKLQEISTALTEAEAQRLRVGTEWQKIKDCLDTGGDLMGIDVIAADPVVSAVRAEILNKEAEVAGLANRYMGKHPALQLASQQLEELQQKMKRACRNVADTVLARLNMAQAKENSLRNAFNEQQKRAFELDRKLIGYQELARNVEADRELYDSVLARMKETSVAGKMDVNNVRLVDRALPPGGPFNIRTQRDLTQAGAVGLMLGLCLAFLLHFADDRIKRTDDVERTTGLPVLAAIPRITKRSPSLRARISEEDRHSPAAEAFRTLRASLSLSPSARKAKHIMITSASAESGKSLVSANLAIVFAHNNCRTLLIDADLRRPSLHRAFDISHEIGLSSVLAGDVQWKDMAMNTRTPNLDLIVVGQIPPNPSELLGSPAMHALLKEAGEQYDKVVLDCPPVFGLSDPLVLMPQVEGVIFVMRFNRSHRRAVLAAVQKLREGQTPLVGAVMNDVDLRRPGGYYYYYHQYAYYYDSYGHKKQKKA